MDKDEMVKILQESGYPAENVDNVVYIHKRLTKGEVKDLQRLFRSVGYNESYGYKLDPVELRETMDGQRKKAGRKKTPRGI